MQVSLIAKSSCSRRAERMCITIVFFVRLTTSRGVSFLKTTPNIMFCNKSDTKYGRYGDLSFEELLNYLFLGAVSGTNLFVTPRFG